MRKFTFFNFKPERRYNSKFIRLLLFCLCLTTYYSTQTQAQTVFGMGDGHLVSFDVKRPNIILSKAPITGIEEGEEIVGMDFRPATGELYALGYNRTTGEATMYTIDPESGEALEVGDCNLILPVGLDEISFDFNPTVDRIRFLGNDGTNLRLHPILGDIAAIDGRLAYASGDTNEGKTASIGAAAYTNSFAGSTSTTLYDYDIILNILTSQIPPNAGVLNTIGDTGIPLDTLNPTIDIDIFYDMESETNIAYAVASIEGVSCRQFYSINLETGEATLLGTIGGEILVSKIAVLLDGEPEETEEFVAMLAGSNEVLPVATTASGTVTASLSGNKLTLNGAYNKLLAPVDFSIAQGAHIHRGFAGQNGPIEIILTVTENEDQSGGTLELASNTFELTNEQVELLHKRQLYINIHTTQFGGGEIRGQLLPASDSYFSTNLSGMNEVPSIMTGASGALVADIKGDTISFSGSFSNLEGDFDANVAGGAHIHVALAGTNGGIALLLDADVSNDLKSGVFTAEKNTFILDENQKNKLMAREFYANIHTTAHPSGELRGQVTGMVDVRYRAHLSGSNEFPFVTSMASGQVIAEVKGDKLIVSGSFSGLESAFDPNVAGGAHIHIGKAGQNGGIAFPLVATMDAEGLAGSFEASDNMFSLTMDQIETLLSRGMYVNIHTEENQAGEIRGQLLPESQIVLNALLTGSQEIPNVISGAHGAAFAEISGNQVIITGSFNDLESDFNADIARGAHLHFGLPGSNGGILHGLVANFNNGLRSGTFEPMDNTIEFSSENLESMRGREVYVNIHTVDNPSGELRGNLLFEAATYFMTPLSGASESASVNVDSRGFVAYEVNPGSIKAAGSFSLETAFDANVAGGAHLHRGFAGSDGGIEVMLQVTPSADLLSGQITPGNNNLELSDELTQLIWERRIYTNIHTSGHSSGEIRGQVMPVALTYFHTSLAGANEVPAVHSEAFGGLKFELTGNSLVVSGSFNNLSSEFDRNVAGGAHVHNGMNGMNGGISFHLNASTNEDDKSGFFPANENVFVLEDEQLADLRNGGLYVNIHTTSHQSGEIRGQILREVNLFPDAAEIESPLDMSIIDFKDVVGDSITVNWSEAGDPNGDVVTYMWQISSDASFDMLLFSVDAGAETTINISVNDVMALIDSNQFMEKDTSTFFHRVITRDGSNLTVGEAARVLFLIDANANIIDDQGEKTQFNIYPNLSNGSPVNIEITSTESSNGSIIIMNQMGQLVDSRNVRINQGTESHTLDVSRLNKGMYFITANTGKGILPMKRLLIQ